jgi:hypothetical protein
MQWRGVAAAEAVSVGDAIEFVLSTLFPDENEFIWNIKMLDSQLINLKLSRRPRPSGRRMSQRSKRLSLWLFSVRELVGNGHDPKITTHTANNEDDNWLRKETQKEQSFRLLGTYTSGLHQDIRWWIPWITDANFMTLTEASQDDSKHDDKVHIARHRVVGVSDMRSVDVTPQFSPEPHVAYRRIHGLPGTLNDQKRPHNGSDVLATISDSPLRLLYAQELFFHFMRAAAMKLSGPVPGEADVRTVETSGSAGNTTWQNFTLQNATLSRIVRGLQETNLLSVEEAYLSVIIPLSKKSKLPSPMIKLVQQRTKSDQFHGRWRRLPRYTCRCLRHQWLFRRTVPSPLRPPHR